MNERAKGNRISSYLGHGDSKWIKVARQIKRMNNGYNKMFSKQQERVLVCRPNHGATKTVLFLETDFTFVARGEIFEKT